MAYGAGNPSLFIDNTVFSGNYRGSLDQFTKLDQFITLASRGTDFILAGPDFKG